MDIQKRVYKYQATKAEFHSCINNSQILSSNWEDENNLGLKKKGPFTFFWLTVNLEELESKGKLKVTLLSDFRYLLIYLVPLALALYGFFRRYRSSEKSLIFILGGISLGIFIFLISASLIDSLKKKFKETLQMS